MSDRTDRGSVQLKDGHSASALLHQALTASLGSFPEMQANSLPASSKVFRSTYPDLLPRFEARRAASDDRISIARQLAGAAGDCVVWQSEQRTLPIEDLLTEQVDPLAVTSQLLMGDPGWEPCIHYLGEQWDAKRLPSLARTLIERNVITESAGESLNWIGENRMKDGALHLTDRKVVMIGAAAEMAPSKLLLEAGVDMLWLDMTPPPDEWLTSNSMAGRLTWPCRPIDLLARPQEALATILAFAEGQPLDIGLYAYAPGQAREFRLTCIMNALVNALPQDLVSSITLLVSPTTPTILSQGDLAAMDKRRETRPWWEAGLESFGALGRGGGSVSASKIDVARTVVSIQGASYQAAQYLGKVIMAECWANYGSPNAEVPVPYRVSANTAAITSTRSLEHPVFAAAFGGATAMAVETFTPELSRSINGLLAVCDWLHPETPVPGSVRVHGGIHTLPYPLESALRVAAGIGFVRSPRLLRGLIG